MATDSDIHSAWLCININLYIFIWQGVYKKIQDYFKKAINYYQSFKILSIADFTSNYATLEAVRITDKQTASWRRSFKTWTYQLLHNWYVSKVVGLGRIIAGGVLSYIVKIVAFWPGGVLTSVILSGIHIKLHSVQLGYKWIVFHQLSNTIQNMLP